MCNPIATRTRNIALEIVKRVLEAMTTARTDPLTSIETTLVAEKVFDDAYKSVLQRLKRGMPITNILERKGIPAFIGPMTQRGYYILIAEEEPERIAYMEKLAGRSLQNDTIISPCGFGTYANYRSAVTEYLNALTSEGIFCEIIGLKEDATDDDGLILSVPHV